MYEKSATKNSETRDEGGRGQRPFFFRNSSIFVIVSVPKVSQFQACACGFIKSLNFHCFIIFTKRVVMW